MQLTLDFGEARRAAARERQPRALEPLEREADGASLEREPRSGPSRRRPAVGVRRLGRPLGREALERRLQRALGAPAELVVTDNRRTMISTRRNADKVQVRVHHMFLEAPGEVVEELLAYLVDGDRRSSRRLARFIDEHKELIKRRPRRVLLRTEGEHHDLQEIFDEVSERWFPGDVEGVRITWGKRPPRSRRRRRSIRLGTYTHDAALVRVHPALDQAMVPRFFVAFVVFHELLHHVVPATVAAGRTNYHPPAFRRRERAHPDYARSIRWETENLDALLKY